MEIVERDIPEPGAMKVRIKVQACGIYLGGAKVILGTVPSGKAMSEVLGGLAINGKLIMIGALEVSPNFFSSLDVDK